MWVWRHSTVQVGKPGSLGFLVGKKKVADTEARPHGLPRESELDPEIALTFREGGECGRQSRSGGMSGFRNRKLDGHVCSVDQLH